MSKEPESSFHDSNHIAIHKLVCQKGLRDDQRKNPHRLQQFRSFYAVVELGGHFASILQPPAQMKWGIAYHIVKADARLVGTDVAMYQIGLRIQTAGHLIGVQIQLASIGVGFHWHIVEEISHAAGQVGH